MRKLFLILSLAWAVAASLPAQTKAEADSAYAEERYDEAITLYTALSEQGEHADVYYNLGNCYYKTDRLAHAILNFERAALLAPGDADIRFNLELARSKTVDKITPESEMFFITWFKDVTNWMSMDAWAALAVSAFAAACLLLLLFFMGNKAGLKKLGFFGALAMLLVCALANVFAARQSEKLHVRSGAVVMASSVTVKSTPDESGTDLFVLHEGTRVEIIDHSMKEWKEIRLADGKVGWMPSKDMEVI